MGMRPDAATHDRAPSLGRHVGPMLDRCLLVLMALSNSISHPPIAGRKVSRPRLLGHEILRRVGRAEVPAEYPLDPRTGRAVLGSREGRYLVPPGIDVLELGLIDTAGAFELLPIDHRDKPLWSEVTHLLVTPAEAERQREIVLCSYRVLCDRIAEAEELRSSVEDWSRRRVAHPVFGTIRFETIATWKSMRRGAEPLGERALVRLHAEVARRVAARIGARHGSSDDGRPYGSRLARSLHSAIAV